MINSNNTPLASDIVIFGGMGDLSRRKLLPSLYQLDASGLLSPEVRIIAVARDDISLATFCQLVSDSLNEYVTSNLNDTCRDAFIKRFSYQQMDLTDLNAYHALTDTLAASSTQAIRLYYFSTPPELYGDISQGLDKSGLIGTQDRIVMEKPIGHCLASSQVINDQVAKYFHENQIYRIDHYLGKETVLNLLVLRFANSLFTHNWDRNAIEHVQITVAESVGIEGRWGFYDNAGQMRDMVQNHLLQILSLLAMEPPAQLNADSIRDEKLKVIKALKPISIDNVCENTVRGQYADGCINKENVPGYTNETGSNAQSTTETFVAIKAEIDNWRWAGVPFYLRTGKRMPKKHSEIVIFFKSQAHNIFKDSHPELPANKLTIRLQPDEGVEFEMLNKVPGMASTMQIHENTLDLSFSKAYDNQRVVDAYERLILEVILGNQSLFVRRDEVEAAWQWADSIIDAWQQKPLAAKPYAAGSWGPEASAELIARDKRKWVE